MANAAYWKERFGILETGKADACGQSIAEIGRMSETAQRELESQIQVWYGRYAVNNEIKMAQAKHPLKAQELAELRREIKGYIKAGEEAGLNAGWLKQLESASARQHITRLEALELQTRQTLEKLYSQQAEAVETLLKRQYLEGYYHTCYEVQKGLHIGKEIAQVEEKILEEAIRKPWTADGRTYRERMWKDRARLLSEVERNLTHNIIRGKTPDAAIRNVKKALETSKSNAGRLIMTESTYVSGLAQKAAYEELGVERYEIVATVDARTSGICREQDGKVYSLTEYKAGVTAPPFHPWCRTTTAPYFEEGIEGNALRVPENGKSDDDPSRMTYEEWKRRYVDKTETPRPDGKEPIQKDDGGLKTGEQSARIKIKVNPDSEIYQKLGEKYYNELHDIINAAPDLERDVWEKMEPELKVISTTANERAYCEGVWGIVINIAENAKGSYWTKPHQITFHEFGHNIDFLANVLFGNGSSLLPFSYTYKNGIFAESIKREVDARIDAIENWMKAGYHANQEYLDWLYQNRYIDNSCYRFCKDQIGGQTSRSMAYKALEYEINALSCIERVDISDILEGATGGKMSMGFGHGKNYWGSKTALPTESFAEMYDSAVASPESLIIIKRYLPESYKIFQEMLEAIKKGRY